MPGHYGTVGPNPFFNFLKTFRRKYSSGANQATIACVAAKHWRELPKKFKQKYIRAAHKVRFQREIKCKKCARQVEKLKPQSRKKTKANVLKRRCATRTAKLGKVRSIITGNPYLNFLKNYRKVHSYGRKASEVVCEGAVQWRKLPNYIKKRYIREARQIRRFGYQYRPKDFIREKSLQRARKQQKARKAPRYPQPALDSSIGKRLQRAHRYSQKAQDSSNRKCHKENRNVKPGKKANQAMDCEDVDMKKQ